ncbi:hypothetical protein KY289_026895 [Solanum tuberosum]|nr:hypothetical protein KY289_026895 [Solanum tuberosum]KAH0661784.1 hypothetical protein KY284_026715 [Solanum tuberosum]
MIKVDTILECGQASGVALVGSDNLAQRFTVVEKFFDGKLFEKDVAAEIVASWLCPRNSYSATFTYTQLTPFSATSACVIPEARDLMA